MTSCDNFGYNGFRTSKHSGERLAKREGMSETDLKVGIAMGAGMTLPEAAAFCGVSEKTVRNHKDAEYARLIKELVQVAVAVKVRHDVEIAAGQLRKEMEKRLGKAVGAVDRAMESGDERVALAAANVVFDRTEGKAVQPMKHQHEGNVQVLHVEIPRETVDYFKALALEMQSTLPMLEGTGNVIDVAASSERLSQQD